MPSSGSRVVLTCGRDGSGKTTFAKQLESTGYTRLSIDDEVWNRISSGVLTPGSDVRHVSLAIEQEIRSLLVDLVRAGRDVVVDYSFPTRSSRDAYRRLVEENGGVVELVHFRMAPGQLHARARSAATGEAREQDSGRASVDRYIDAFEEPVPDEQPIVVDGFAGELQ